MLQRNQGETKQLWERDRRSYILACGIGKIQSWVMMDLIAQGSVDRSCCPWTYRKRNVSTSYCPSYSITGKMTDSVGGWTSHFSCSSWILGCILDLSTEQYELRNCVRYPYMFTNAHYYFTKILYILKIQCHKLSNIAGIFAKWNFTAKPSLRNSNNDLFMSWWIISVTWKVTDRPLKG